MFIFVLRTNKECSVITVCWIQVLKGDRYASKGNNSGLKVSASFIIEGFSDRKECANPSSTFFPVRVAPIFERFLGLWMHLPLCKSCLLLQNAGILSGSMLFASFLSSF